MAIKFPKIYTLLAIIFGIIAIISAVLSFFICSIATIIIGVSTTFATLAGAIIVFSTLDVQHKALEVEIKKNELARFDSRFYQVLSSFRMDAVNMESIIDCIREKGKGFGLPYTTSFFGDKAFYINRRVVETLYNLIRNDTYEAYNAEDIRIELEEISKKEDYIYDNWPSDEDFDKINKERTHFIHSQQGAYLLYKYGITKEKWQQYKEKDRNALLSILLDLLIGYQPNILSKYIQSMRFILHIIENIPKEIDRNDYYLNVSCLLGKEELLFLQCFSEFNIISKKK